jgi:hypothetical protein
VIAECESCYALKCGLMVLLFVIWVQGIIIYMLTKRGREANR